MTTDLQRFHDYQAIRELEMALQGDNETAQQLRATVTGATKLVDDLEQKRAELAGNGLYTPAGVDHAIEDDAIAALAKLEDYLASQLEPRLQTITAALDQLPDPQPTTQLTDGERDRLISRYLQSSRDERMRMLAHIHESPKLAAALALEDPSVTGLGAETLDRLRAMTTKDDQADQRSTLTSQLAATRAAIAALDGAAASVRRIATKEST